ERAFVDERPGCEASLLDEDLGDLVEVPARVEAAASGDGHILQGGDGSLAGPHHRHSDAFLGELLDLGEEAAAGEGEVGPQGELRREAVGEEDDVLQLLRRAAQGLGGLPEAGDDPGLAPGAYRADALLDLAHVGVLLEGHQPAVVATEGEDAYLVVRPQGLDGPAGTGLGDGGREPNAGA